MFCRHPFHAFPTGRLTELGAIEYYMDFSRHEVITPYMLHKRFPDIKRTFPLRYYLEVPCGTCYECRKNKARQWSYRCMAEAMEHDQSYFLTLTYEKAPEDYEVLKDDFQRFIHSLRFAHQFRYFACLEFGENNTKRAHFHILAFGLKLDRRLFHRVGVSSGHPLYTTDEITDIWKKGIISVGDAAPSDVGNYIAKYTIKSEGRKGKLFYSLKPGIGMHYLENHLPKDDFLFYIGKGNGQVLKFGYPRTLKRRLGLATTKRSLYLSWLTQTDAMLNAGYSYQDIFDLEKRDQYAASVEYADLLQEVDKAKKQI